MMSIWQFDSMKYQWKLQERIAPVFNERFRVFMKGENYLFVTESGKVYIAKPVAKGQRKIEPLWDDPKRPVVAVISDSDGKKDYLFTRAAKDARQDGKDVYFEVAEKLVPRPFDPVPEPDRTDAIYPMNALIPYGQVLLKAGLIRGK